VSNFFNFYVVHRKTLRCEPKLHDNFEFDWRCYERGNGRY